MTISVQTLLQSSLPIGYTGSAGFTGSAGSGFTGSAGTNGFTGSAGSLGYTGSAGFTGSVGFVGSQGSIPAWQVKTSTYTAVSGDRIIASTAGGAFTINLPATPSAGNTVEITDGASFATNNLTIGRNGSTIEGNADDVLITIPNATFEFFYTGTTWQVTATYGPRGYTGSASSYSEYLFAATFMM